MATTEPVSATPLHAPASSIVLGRSPLHGRGVFAARDIAAGEVLETAPAIIVPVEEAHIDSTWSRYVFGWDDDGHHVALAAGLVSMLNHDDEPNAAVHMDAEGHLFEVVALTDIAAGTELLIDYGPDYPFDWR